MYAAFISTILIVYASAFTPNTRWLQPCRTCEVVKMSATTVAVDTKRRDSIVEKAVSCMDEFISSCYVEEECDPYTDTDCKFYEPCPSEDSTRELLSRIFSVADSEDGIDLIDFQQLDLILTVVQVGKVEDGVRVIDRDVDELNEAFTSLASPRGAMMREEIKTWITNKKDFDWPDRKSVV